MQLQDDGSVLHIHDADPHTRTGGNACLLRLMAVPTLLMALGLVGTSVAALRVDFALFIGVFLLLLGVVMLTGASNQKRIDLRAHLWFEPATRLLHVYRASPERAMVIPLASIRLLVVRRGQVLGSETPKTEYIVSAVLNDDAELYLFCDTQAERVRAQLDTLCGVLGVRVVDEAGRGWARDATRTWEPAAVPQATPSRFVRHETSPSGPSWSLCQERTTGEKVMQACVWSLFFLVPAMIVGNAVMGAVSTPSVGTIVGLVLSGGVALLVAGIAAVMFSIQARTYRVSLDRTHLQIVVQYRHAFLQKQLGKTLSIPRAFVRYVRVSRERSGALSLDLLHTGEAAVHEARSWLREEAFLALMGPIPRRKLWTFMPGTVEGQGADFADAAHLLHTLREELGLTDRPSS